MSFGGAGAPDGGFRQVRFAPRRARPLRHGMLAQSQQEQRHFAIPFEHLSRFPSLAQDSELQRMAEDAKNLSIDVKEDISTEMCAMLRDKARHWQRTMQRTIDALPGDLDHLDPLSYSKPLVEYSVGGVVEAAAPLGMSTHCAYCKDPIPHVHRPSGKNAAPAGIAASLTHLMSPRSEPEGGGASASPFTSAPAAGSPSMSTATTAATAAATSIDKMSGISGHLHNHKMQALAEAVPGMTKVLEAIEDYEVQHSPDLKRRDSAAKDDRSGNLKHRVAKDRDGAGEAGFDEDEDAF